MSREPIIMDIIVDVTYDARRVVDAIDAARERIRENVEYGDREVALANEILRTVVGSGVHGIAIEGTDDHDEMGVYIEPPEYVFGPVHDFEAPSKRLRDDYISRTQPEGVLSGPGDTDLVIYSLRKYLRLAIKGNPTVLLPLYAPESDVLVQTTLGNDLRDMRSMFLSQDAAQRFLAYMEAQRERMMGGGKRNRVPARPELVERYGWDVKYGSHALRLAMECFEIVTTGTLSLPMSEANREHVLAVKRGEVPRVQVDTEVTWRRNEIRAMLEQGLTPLPEHADLEAIVHWSAAAHRRHWRWGES